MNEPITRRDFVNGALVASAGVFLNSRLPATVSPAEAFNGYSGVGDYRGANGNTYDVVSVAHAMRDGAFEHRAVIDTGEMYDLVAVGGGISGLAAAVFFQKNKEIGRAHV